MNHRHAAAEIRPHARSSIKLFYTTPVSQSVGRAPLTALEKPPVETVVTAVTLQLLLQWFRFGQMTSSTNTNLENTLQRLAMSFDEFLNNHDHKQLFLFSELLKQRKSPQRAFVLRITIFSCLLRPPLVKQ